MQCEILMIGSELLLGQILDTNARLMAQALAENGINLYQKTTVGDNAERIQQALNDALSRSNAVLTSGGLGPTEDDITRECIAELLDRPLEFREELFTSISARLARFKSPITENNKKQAYAPRGAVAIENPHGTAPGLIVEDSRGVIICMPGVPWELEPMLFDHVIPYLQARFHITGTIHSRVLKVCAMGESRVDAAIGDLMRTQANPTIGVLASPDAVRIRLTAQAESRDAAEKMIDALETRVRERLPGLILAEHETPESVVDRLLAEQGLRFVVAEAGTGGMVAQRYTLAAGVAFKEGRVFALSGNADLRQTARDMARKTDFGTDGPCAVLAVAASATTESAVAVYAGPEEVVWDFSFPTGDERARIRLATSVFEQLRRHLLNVT